jgi:hypothetical protein
MTPDLVLRNPGDVYALINSGRLRPRRATMVAAVALGSITQAITRVGGIIGSPQFPRS